MADTLPGDRVITGARLRAAHTWAQEQRTNLVRFDCAGRVLATVGFLIGDDTGAVTADDLQAALRDVDTVDVALDLLTDTGLGCA